MYVQYRAGNNKEAEQFIRLIKDSLAADGIKNVNIRKQKVTVQSYDPNSFLKLKKKEYDAYVFYITVKW